MNLLFVSHLYPNSTEPDLAPYNRNLIRALARRVKVRVIAPVFWFPGRRWLTGRRCPPRHEVLDRIFVEHPQVLYPPRLFVHRHAWFYRHAVASTFRALLCDFRPDHVMVGFAYPDGVALMPLCREVGVPCSIRLHGSDFLIRVHQPAFRRPILETLAHAEKIVCPGRALADAVQAVGLDPEKIVVFRNGVDFSHFHPRSWPEALADLQRTGTAGCLQGFLSPAGPISRPLVLFVGRLETVKGADRLLHAWDFLMRGWGADPHAPALLVIGDGSLRSKLARRARQSWWGETVRFLGARPQAEVARWMNLAHCLCLPSRSEGMPNVLLEALSSGLPVVASRVGEIPFVIRPGENGMLVDNNSPYFEERFSAALAECIRKNWPSASLAVDMRSYTWEAAAENMLRAFLPPAGGRPCRTSEQASRIV